MVKAKLDHGQWGDWLHAEFSLTDRSAQRYMQAFETFGNKPDANLLYQFRPHAPLPATPPPNPPRRSHPASQQTGKSPTKPKSKEIIPKYKATNTLSGATTFTWLRNAKDLPGPSDARMASVRPTADDAEYLLPPNQRFDSQVYKRVRSQLLEELRQPTKPAEPRSTTPAPITAAHPQRRQSPAQRPPRSAICRPLLKSQPDVKSRSSIITPNLSGCYRLPNKRSKTRLSMVLIAYRKTCASCSSI